jgi:hypothetical protein
LENAVLPEPSDFGARLEELKLLKVGWLDGKGIPPAQDGLNWLAAEFDRSYPDDLPSPYLYPTAEGGVRAEWSILTYELSLEIDVKLHVGNWHALDLENDAEETGTLNLDAPPDWEWLAAKVRRLMEKHA